MCTDGQNTSFFNLKLNFMCEPSCCGCLFFFIFLFSYAHSCSRIKLCSEINIARIEGEMKNIAKLQKIKRINFQRERKREKNSEYDFK